MPERTPRTDTTTPELDRAADLWVDVDGVQVRYTDRPGPADGPTYVLVHGLGGALTNWDWLAPLLAEHGRVLALDLGGFGLTQVPDGKSTVPANRALLDGFLKTLDLDRVVLVGNSMGGAIVTQETLAEPSRVAAVVLIDPLLPSHPRHRPHPMVLAVFGVYMVPPVGRRLLDGRAAKVAPERLALDSIVTVVAHLRAVPQWLLDRHVQLVRERMEALTGPASTPFLAAARSVVGASMTRAYARSFDRLSAAAPVLLIHGEKDRLVNITAARRMAIRHPEWTFVEGADLGHCPMFENAPWVAEVIQQWVGEIWTGSTRGGMVDPQA